ncbi:MAG TPA: hypothetical protein VHE55_07850 [Fimbriimonadaceae bacterium]|nr:hypothetical protein [Fimbriimonadaceae bacterium]
MAGRVWGMGQKWMGNLIPILCMLPFGLVGTLLMVKAHEVTAVGVVLCVLALVVGWLAVNQFGFFGNAKLRREIQRKVLAKAGKDASGGTFVGFARPSYIGLLDAHEDLGFLFVGAESLEYLGEQHQVSVAKADVKGVRFRANVHSLLGLGRWVSIEAIHKGKPVRLLVEPREEATLLGNRKRGTRLRKEIEEWRRS